jgi:hypothetical protein
MLTLMLMDVVLVMLFAEPVVAVVSRLHCLLA